MESCPVRGAANRNAPLSSARARKEGPNKQNLFLEKLLAPKELQALPFQEGGGLEGQAGQMACFSAAWYLLHSPRPKTGHSRDSDLKRVSSGKPFALSELNVLILSG